MPEKILIINNPENSSLSRKGAKSAEKTTAWGENEKNISCVEIPCGIAGENLKFTGKPFRAADLRGKARDILSEPS
jgi:hypothetical protein